MKKIFIFLFVAFVFLSGCSKNDKTVAPPDPKTPEVKITLLSGDNQTDTIGNSLHDEILVEVTEDGTPKSGYTIQFVGSGCDQTDKVSTPSGPDGTTNYAWSLAGEVGKQALKIYVLNSKNIKADSVTVHATALAVGPGWHRSGCSIQTGSSPATFCKLSTGRLFTCFPGNKSYLRYSDDNGASWYAVKSLGNTHTITWVLSTPSDELLAFTKGTDGTFYSNNGGQTWSNLGVPPFNTELFSSIVCTRSGKLLATTALDPPLSISNDKGKTWTTVPFSAFVPQNMVSPTFHDPTEDQEGNLYVIELQNENLFKSKDSGKKWSLVPPIPTSFPGTDNSFYVDNNDWFYRSIGLLGYGVFISKDKGANYTQLIPYSAGKMSVQSDGNLYYIANNKLFDYNFTTGLPNQVFGDGLNKQVSAYIVAKNNNIIVDNLGNLYIMYHTN